METAEPTPSLGEVAYNAYCASRGWKSVHGEPLPQFNDQRPEIQAGWTNAASAVLVASTKRSVHTSAPNPELGLWTSVFDFALRMTAKLERHKHTRGADRNWRKDGLTELVNHLKEEFNEFYEALRSGSDQVADEGADLANLTMIVSDWCLGKASDGIADRRELPPALIHTFTAGARPKIVCLCGSSRFADVIAVQAWELEKQGCITLSLHLLPDWYAEQTNKKESGHFAEQEGVASILDRLHLAKIDMADEVLVVNHEGYIGQRTMVEIAYARERGKPVRYLHPLAESFVHGGGQ